MKSFCKKMVCIRYMSESGTIASDKKGPEPPTSPATTEDPGGLQADTVECWFPKLRTALRGAVCVGGTGHGHTL